MASARIGVGVRGGPEEDKDDDKSVPSVVTVRDPSEKATSVTVHHDGTDWRIKNSAGETLPRKFTSRSDAKKFVGDKIQGEVNRRYNEALAAGTLKRSDPKG